MFSTVIVIGAVFVIVGITIGVIIAQMIATTVLPKAPTWAEYGEMVNQRADAQAKARRERESKKQWQ